MAVITICSDFGAPQNKLWHCFHCFPIYFPWISILAWRSPWIEEPGGLQSIGSLTKSRTWLKRLSSSSSSTRETGPSNSADTVELEQAIWGVGGCTGRWEWTLGGEGAGCGHSPGSACWACLGFAAGCWVHPVPVPRPLALMTFGLNLVHFSVKKYLVSTSSYHFIAHKVSLCKLLSGWKPSTFGSWITLWGN